MLLRRNLMHCLLALGLSWTGAGVAAPAEQQASDAGQAGQPVQTAPDNAQSAAFFRAVQVDDARTVKSMLAGGFDPNVLNPVSREPALVLAVREEAMRVFDALLADPRLHIDTPAANGNTALMMAAFKHNRKAADTLVARGAAVNRPGWTPLHYAAASGDDDIAAMLLQRGAAIDAPSPRPSGSFTPLMMAAREGHPDSVRFLLEKGADPALKNGEGLDAARIAERAGHDAIAKTLRAALAAGAPRAGGKG